MNDNKFYSFIHLSSVECDSLIKNGNIKTYPVCLPSEEYLFLHEASAIEYKGRIFAAWYQNEKDELIGKTPIFWAYSDDKGKTFSKKILLAIDESAEILYCPPVFGIVNGKLYMLINEMYKLPDHIHSLDTYVYNEDKNSFELLKKEPVPFKLNTNVYKLDNGKLFMPGRIAELDGFPNTPAVLINDSGKIEDSWRLVKVRENGDLPDGSHFIHPEQSAIVEGNKIIMFCRTDMIVDPLVFISEDYGEHWSEPKIYDVPIGNSKIYSGKLSNGIRYWIGNIVPRGRRKLALLYSKPDENIFSSGFLIQDGENPDYEGSGKQWSYPVAFEYDEKLYVIYSASMNDNEYIRGALLTIIPFEELK